MTNQDRNTNKHPSQSSSRSVAPVLSCLKCGTTIEVNADANAEGRANEMTSLQHQHQDCPYCSALLQHQHEHNHQDVNADGNVEGRQTNVEPLQHHHEHYHHGVNADATDEGRTVAGSLQHQHQDCPYCSSLLQHNHQHQHSPDSSLLQPQHYHQHQIDPDEINLLEYIYVLVKHKWWIIGATVAGLLLGYAAALIKGPTWTATAVIAPKESDKGAPNVSGFGAFGGIVASQLGLGGNASLEKIDVVLGSRKFNAEMIEKCSNF